ncbi:hypothetical protein TNCV_2431101 [Trichonephila clavipes]|nr:hypothetical protein TNCV_2431101 [Trichonephila clavipes]
MEACNEKFHGIKRPTGRWDVQTPLGKTTKMTDLNETSVKRRVNEINTRASSTMDDPREELEKKTEISVGFQARYLEGL